MQGPISTRAEFDAELTNLQNQLLNLGSMVEKAGTRAVDALKSRDLAASEIVVKDDDEIDQKRVEIEDALEADRIFTILMGDKVAPRRQFIESHSVELDMASLDI